MTDSFVFYGSFFDAIEDLDEQDKFRFAYYITQYGTKGIEPENLSGFEKAFWKQIKFSIDESKARRQQNINNGKKGGSPKLNNRVVTETEPTYNRTITEVEPTCNRLITEPQPKDNLNVDVNVDVDVDVDVEVDVDVDVKDEVQEVLSELFETEKPFTDDFETTTTTFFQKNNINKIEYCHFVYDYAKKVCSQNKNINLKGFYYKHFADNDILAEYQSRIKQKDLDKQKELSNFEHCPICGKSIDRRLFRSCPDCNFGIEHFGEVAEVEKYKKFMKLSKQVQEDYTQKKDDLLTKFMIKQLNKTEFAQKVDELERNYGLIA